MTKVKSRKNVSADDAKVTQKKTAESATADGMKATKRKTSKRSTAGVVKTTKRKTAKKAVLDNGSISKRTSAKRAGVDDVKIVKRKIGRKPSPKNVKIALDKYANESDIKGALQYIEDHKEAIAKIITDFGSGNPYITNAYDIAYDKNDYSFAEEYERKLESINSKAIFWEDGYDRSNILVW